MQKEYKKQAILGIMSICLIAIGILNFKFSESIEVASTSAQNDVNLGDVELVNAEPEIDENIILQNALVENEEENLNDENMVEENKTEENSDEYFTETKIERDSMYSEMIETYTKMLNSTEISESQKLIATQEIENITTIKNGIMIAENLIKNKGFENVVILVNKDNVSVIIKSTLLTTEQIAQIQNIVSKELSVDVSNITISNR